MAQFTIDIIENYVKPEGALTPEQYVNFVMNSAAASYMSSYGTVDKMSGVQAACDQHNADLLPAEEPSAP